MAVQAGRTVLSVGVSLLAWAPIAARGGEARHAPVSVACVPAPVESPETAKALADSAQDLKKALYKKKDLIVAEDPASAQVKVEILDREAGAFHSAPGILAIRDMQLRFRISLGSASWEESATGEQTFRRAAENAAKRIDQIVALRYAEIAQP